MKYQQFRNWWVSHKSDRKGTEQKKRAVFLSDRLKKVSLSIDSQMRLGLGHIVEGLDCLEKTKKINMVSNITCYVCYFLSPTISMVIWPRQIPCHELHVFVVVWIFECLNAGPVITLVYVFHQFKLRTETTNHRWRLCSRRFMINSRSFTEEKNGDR